MREAARALDDVSDHLGEVLRHADDLLAEWSRFGAQVRTQVEREAIAIGDTVDAAVARAATAGIDRAIAERLRALTGEIERLEQRTKAAARAVAEQRAVDRRVLWAVVAGVVLANALLVVLLVRKPEPVVVSEPVRIETSTVPAPLAQDPPTVIDPVSSSGSGSAAGDPESTGGAGSASAAQEPAVAAGSAAGSGAQAPGAGSGGAQPAGAKAIDATTGAGKAAPGAKPAGAKPASHATSPPRYTPSPIALPPKANPRGHKKQ